MRHLFYVIIVFSFIQLNAQTDRNNILSTNFNYNFNHKDYLDDGEYLNGIFNGVKNNDLNFNTSVGRKLKTNFYYGVGLSYKVSKQEINPDSDIPEYSGTVNSYWNMISKDNTISPIIFIQYFNNLSDRFCIAIELFSKYDFNNNITRNTRYDPDFTSYTYIETSKHKTEEQKQDIHLGIRPSIKFNIIENFGMEFTFGILEYSRKIMDSRRDDIDKKTEEFELGFKPENWLIGFYLKI